MTSYGDFVQPPRIAVWLVTLFAPAEQAEAILGDLLEEFFHLASKSGSAFARSWYWRQAFRTVAHLSGEGFRTAPWSTFAAVAGGFLLIRLSFRLPELTIMAVLVKYQVPDHHFGVYKFWITDGIVIGLIVLSTLVGAVVAMVAKGREMTATIALGFIRSALGVIGAIVMVTTAQHYWTFRPMLHQFMFAIATVAGGAIVRMRRASVIARRSAT